MQYKNNMPTSTLQTKQAATKKGTLKDAMDYASRNPKSDFARQLELYIDSGMADEEAALTGIDLTPFGRPISPNLSRQSKAEEGIENERTFIEEAVPAAFSVAGGIGGGILGAPLGPAGIVGGAALGAASMGAVGEGVQQTIEKSQGLRTEYSPRQIAETGLISGILQAAFPVGGSLIKGGVQMAKPQAVKLLSMLSGYAENVIQRALQRTPGTVTALKEGEKALTDIVKQTASGLQKYANQSLKEGKDLIERLSKQSGGGAGFPGTRQALLEEGDNFIGNVTRKLRENYNIGVEKGNELLFERGVEPSRIVSGTDKATITDAFRSMVNLTKDTTIKNIDATLERLMVLRSKTPGGTPTGGETKKIIGDMIEEIVGFARSLENVGGKAYKEYADYLVDNLPVRVFINDAKELFGASAHLSPKEVTQISTRLLQIFNQGRGEIREFAEKVGEKTGKDIVGTSAGTLIKAGDEISVRAKNLTRRGMLEQVAQYIPRALIQNYIKTGDLTSFATNPVVSTVVTLTGLTAKQIAQMLANLSQGKSTSETEEE